MQFGAVVPGGSPREQVELAVVAERQGWDGVFVFEAAYGHDAWSVLAAMAERTERVRLGTMLTPLPWRRPWKLASQVATLDHLSLGRAILAVGLGALETGWGGPPDEHDRRARAELLDEGIDLIAALWDGGLSYEGSRLHFDLRDGPIEPFRPVQVPRPPIWVVGAWPRERSMTRVLRGDGLVPNVMDPTFRPATPTDVAAMAAWLDAHGRARPAFDIVVEGETPSDPVAAAGTVAAFADAGATWWLETRWVAPEGAQPLDLLRDRVLAGPPRP